MSYVLHICEVAGGDTVVTGAYSTKKSGPPSPGDVVKVVPPSEGNKAARLAGKSRIVLSAEGEVHKAMAITYVAGSVPATMPR